MRDIRGIKFVLGVLAGMLLLGLSCGGDALEESLEESCSSTATSTVSPLLWTAEFDDAVMLVAITPDGSRVVAYT